MTREEMLRLARQVRTEASVSVEVPENAADLAEGVIDMICASNRAIASRILEDLDELSRRDDRMRQKLEPARRSIAAFKREADELAAAADAGAKLMGLDVG